jgi:hypothetical protein
MHLFVDNKRIFFCYCFKCNCILFLNNKYNHDANDQDIVNDRNTGKMLLLVLLFTLHVPLDIRQHSNENYNEEQEEKKSEGIVTHINWFIQLLKSTSSYNDRE